MASNSYDMTCSVAKSLEDLGERWTFLIIRDALYGVRRFDGFQRDLGVARNILSKRLAGLVDAGIMRKDLYEEHPPRYEYRLTEKGRDLVPIITSLVAWGDKWEHAGNPPVALVHTECGEAMHTVAVCDHCGGKVDAFNLNTDPILPTVADRQTSDA